jgi:hypothetical protein
MAIRRPGSGVGSLELVADIGQLLVFAVLVYRAYLLRRTRPDAHKRLMVCATATLLLPALARWPWKISLLYFALLYLTAPAVLIAWDLISLRRVHSSSLLGVGLMLLLIAAALLLAGTPQAAGLVDWIRHT